MMAVTACAIVFYYFHIALGINLNQTIVDMITKKQNISDDQIMVNLDSFVSYEGVRRRDTSMNGTNALRIYPSYWLPQQRNLNIKILDLMKQSVYATQDRLAALEPVMQKYNNNPAFRMSFIFNRLNQLIIDIRRIYTVALKMLHEKKTFESIIWYSNCVRKYIDILYIVEHTIQLHTQYSKTLTSLLEDFD